MNMRTNINEEVYRHAKFLQTLTYSELEAKLLRLFLKVNQNSITRNKINPKFEDHSLNNQKIAVEY